MSFFDEISRTVAELGRGVPEPLKTGDGRVYETPAGYQYPQAVYPAPGASWGSWEPSYAMGQFVLSPDARVLLYAMIFLLALALVTRK